MIGKITNTTIIFLLQHDMPNKFSILHLITIHTIFLGTKKDTIKVSYFLVFQS